MVLVVGLVVAIVKHSQPRVYGRNWSSDKQWVESDAHKKPVLIKKKLGSKKERCANAGKVRQNRKSAPMENDCALTVCYKYFYVY